jgi:hypothetical protein
MTGVQGPDPGAIYHIRVRGNLDAKWADWFDGFVMVSRNGDETLLAGGVEDQAVLHGVLARPRGLGLPLLFLVQAECPCRQANCPRHGLCSGCFQNHATKGRVPYCFREKTRWDKQCAALI